MNGSAPLNETAFIIIPDVADANASRNATAFVASRNVTNGTAKMIDGELKRPRRKTWENDGG